MTDEETFELPYELTYGLFVQETPSFIDESKLQYNNKYKTFEYFQNKFSLDTSHIAGFDKIIQSMADNAKSPLEEYLERQYNAEQYYEQKEDNERRSDSNISEFKDSQ